MKNLSIAQLDPIKLPLLKKLYKLHYPSTKIKAGEVIYVAELEGKIVGVTRFRQIEDWQLLTGMMVVTEEREKGIAAEMLEQLQTNYLDSKVYCFAYSHLVDMYAKHGFVSIPENELPGSLKGLFSKYSQTKALNCMQYQR